MYDTCPVVKKIEALLNNVLREVAHDTSSSKDSIKVFLSFSVRSREGLNFLTREQVSYILGIKLQII